MTLIRYKEKRRFDSTPEPEGKVASSKGALKFVVQKHQASHLHYDFRLEMEGVLKSWAVPKGPSLNPRYKRLAMMVEDHPLDYGDFEGHIPEGNYGAGDVIVWDAGTYFAVGATSRVESEQLLLQGLVAGKMDFFMEGEKLKGEFSLIKFKRGGDKSWLLFKKSDSYANEAADVLEDEASVLSGKKVKERKPTKSISDQLIGKPEKFAVTPHGAVQYIKPMLATLVDEPFDRQGWIFEIKWDGYRAIAEIGEEPRLYSRNGKDYSKKYSEIFSELQHVHPRATLDGEIVVLNDKGLPDFQMLQNYGSDKKGKLVFYAFDLLSLAEKDTKHIPLLQRKELLKKLLKNNLSAVIKYSDHVLEKGTALFAEAQKKGIEGIVAKNGQSAYAQGARGEDWLKIKTHKRQEAIICGFTEPKGSRKYFGSLVLGIFENGQLVYVGNSGSGFNSKSLKIIDEQLKPLITSTSPFDYKVTALTPITWVRPKLVCEVEFTDWTGVRQMRHPIFKGLRDDKKPKEITRENEVKSENIIAVSEKQSINTKYPSIKTQVQLTNFDKIYWTKERYTNGDLTPYYQQVSKIILPYLKDRAESLNRHPQGADKPGFFQKNVTGEIPNFVKTVAIKSDSGNKDIHYIVCQNEATLLYMANLGCIELNPWNSRVQNLDKPDYAVLDLDPGEISFQQVVKVAQCIHKILDDIEVESYCKTSGKSGLHIFIPAGANYTYDQVKQFTQLIAMVVHQKLPGTTSIARDPRKRKTCIYLDFLQNRFGQTLAAPYSVRPWPGATVSTPLMWKEVNAKLDPGKFTIKTMPKRLDVMGDIWVKVLRKGFNLGEALKSLKKLIEIIP